MRNEKGITMVILIITVVLMAILAAVAIKTGGNSLDTVKLQNFNYEMQQIQGKVDAIYEKIKLGNEDYIILGNQITDSEEAMNTLKNVKGINYSGLLDSQREEYYYQDNFTYYRYLTQNDLENLFDITSEPGDMIINFTTREVISVKGFVYQGRTYHTLSDMK